ncbi:MAG: general secretion pathway protein GspK [Phycisphaeraceae bacterium]|nr:MAG: general secretion pathway protein GspK [Phycisphaeraceae bacterium]
MTTPRGCRPRVAAGVTIGRGPARSFATLLVLWVVAIAAVVLASVSASSAAQASAGREALARVRAFWAARAAVEQALALIDFDTENPVDGDAFALIEDLANHARGELRDAAWIITHETSSGERLGVMDAHAKININLATAEQLALIPDMSEDGPDSILDWIDADDDTRPLGAESGYYLGRPFPYEPRNGPMRSIAELELVIGMSPELVRGEDWNLNGRLDENEDDGDVSWPPDNADGRLDAGLSAYLTTASVDGGLAASGEARLDLATATASQVSQRIGVDALQADVIVAYAATSNAQMSEFIRRTLRQLAQTAGIQNAAAIRNLTREQQAVLFNEAGIALTAGTKPGKLNINTCEAETLQYLPEITPALADAIILERSSRPNGFSSIVDLLDVPAMTPQRLARIAGILDVRSNVFVASCRGRDARSGIEVEIIATIDRSTVPAVLKEVRIR